ncbi:phosphatase PAP2 family protein [Saccharopolyspora gloriosae]|uniref:phosphatase PAP2 family protein n=1 Tax=Saccharopolyspora gloriosae TaxID=455344 RepID=UPI001FB76F9E|nr:phosphatase PAP2 family protein [Saccharopolyspora gloriosae]
MADIDVGPGESTGFEGALRRRGDRTARVLTEVFSPAVIVLLLPIAVAWSATHSPGPALGWGVFVALTSSVLPMAGIVAGSRLGWWDGHHVRNREGRLIPLLLLIVFSSVGLGVLVLAGAPRLMVALDLAMLSALLVVGLITVWWKVSVHTAVAAGATAILAEVYSPWLLLLWLLTAAVGWSRVRLGDHTPAQALVGALVGVAAGALGYLRVA